MKCSKCKFWNYEEDFNGIRIGTCRKHAPSLDNEARWPVVSEAEFCHEFEERLETKDDLCHAHDGLCFYTLYTGTDLLRKIQDYSSIKWSDTGEHPTEWYPNPNEDGGVALILDERSTELAWDDCPSLTEEVFVLDEEEFIQECSRRCPKTDLKNG